MFKLIATDVVISKGYDGAPALKFSENGESVRFRIGKKVYDTRAENNTRWVNLSVKAFGPVCERIKKMQLKESSFINILGRLDEDVWEDSTAVLTLSENALHATVVRDRKYRFVGARCGNLDDVMKAVAMDFDFVIVKPEVFEATLWKGEPRLPTYVEDVPASDLRLWQDRGAHGVKP